MICTKCGLENAANAQFCYNCGQQFNLNNYNQQMGTIILNRPNSFFGCLIPFDVYIDNVKVASLSNNSSVQIPVSYGTHQLELKQFLNNGKCLILVNENQKNLVFQCSIEFGLLVNSIKIVLLNFYN